ncbi:phosphatase PAP2 family protein [Carboxylicivirga sp. N1Y90]|uniref:phosphatase PAP2 family protein n=1 Tax=Carboxylicivirga fragile TaxID=3417571 RepID=UPI003D34ECAE|nr:phosphatase PAP2 family protein [Marinilabiliaceae bacterium N1Y90]
MPRLKLSSIWIVVLFYLLFTLVLCAIWDVKYLQTLIFWRPRLIVLIFILFRTLLLKTRFRAQISLIDALLVYFLLGSFYTETAHLNTLLFAKWDSYLDMADMWMFGFQPALLFSKVLNHGLFSELMFMGYFSYYLMPLATFVVVWVNRKVHFEKVSFIILTSFFLYYVLFILMPAEGPQYFYAFPHNQIEAKGVFAFLVKQIQLLGEAPTAAFPSSHVGVSVIILLILSKHKLMLFWILLPFVIILCFSTVYIKAHYAVDVFAGLISAPLILKLSSYIYSKLKLQ